MPDINDIVGFGKIIFIPAHESVPPLPDMKLLLFREEERGDIFPYRAVCINLEIDACGDSIEEAWEGLRNSLTMYIGMEKTVAGGSIFEAAKKITQAASIDSNQKKEYFAIYKEAKHAMRNLDSGKILNPISEKRDHLERLEVDTEASQFSIDFVKDEDIAA